MFSAESLDPSTREYDKFLVRCVAIFSVDNYVYVFFLSLLLVESSPYISPLCNPRVARKWPSLIYCMITKRAAGPPFLQLATQNTLDLTTNHSTYHRPSSELNFPVLCNLYPEFPYNQHIN